MIAVDTSALMAIILDEDDAPDCIEALEMEGEVLISAATLAEALIVAGRRNVLDEMSRLTTELGMTVIPLNASAAKDVAAAYNKWGKGVHAAGLNFGDCFSYALAYGQNCPLLYVGGDFNRTDVKNARRRG